MSFARDNTTPGGHQLQEKAAGLQQLFEAKAAAELKAADLLAPGSDAVASRGALLAEVLVIKGLPGPAEASGGEALSGADGEGLAKALTALGHDESQIFYALSRPEPGLGAEERTARLRALADAVDAELVIACDAEAAEDLAAAFGAGSLVAGKLVRFSGRRLLALSGFEAALASDTDKKRVWKELQAAVPRPSVY